jgi:hypothetical protein
MPSSPSDLSTAATELLERVRSCTISPEDLERELWKLSEGHQRRGRRYERGTVRIYRTRAWDAVGRPGSVSDLSYPPPEACRLNRANDEREQVFYASAGLPPSFVECRLQSGQHVVCGEWRNVEAMILQEVGLPGDAGTHALEQVYREIFTAPAADKYRYSARIAHHLMQGQVSGILYPSIASQNKSHNLALKAAYVDVGVRLANAALYYVKTVSSGNVFETEEVDFAIPDSEGLLEWKGRRRQWVLRKQGDELKMVSNGWTWDAYAPDGTLVDPE